MKREIFIIIAFLLPMLAGKEQSNINAQMSLINGQKSYCSILIQTEDDFTIHQSTGEYIIERGEYSLFSMENDICTNVFFDHLPGALHLYSSYGGFFIETESFIPISVYMSTGILCMRRIIHGSENIILPQGEYFVEIEDIIYQIVVK